jgi:hypothetical protein
MEKNEILIVAKDTPDPIVKNKDLADMVIIFKTDDIKNARTTFNSNKGIELVIIDTLLLNEISGFHWLADYFRRRSGIKILATSSESSYFGNFDEKDCDYKFRKELVVKKILEILKIK